MEATMARKRILVFIVAYNAERTIRDVIQRIPHGLAEYETEILIIDDSSEDRTFEEAHRLVSGVTQLFPVTILFNPANQGYGGNQKIGLHYAIRKNFDIVALVHGDGQYAPECLPRLLQPLVAGQADAVFGSRMMEGLSALRGGMPLYKYVGNRILTAFQNWLLDSSLSEFHSGYRLYSVPALERIPFDRNTNDFHFDTEIILQFFRAGFRIKELPIPTYYGDEICNVNGLRYAFHVVITTLLDRAQDLGILYQRKFDLSTGPFASPYKPKMTFESPHTLVLERVAAGSTVLDVGCASGYVAEALKRKRCNVVGVDQFPVSDDLPLDRFVQHDLDQSEFPLGTEPFQYILLLDVIEHLRSPETFVEILRSSRKSAENTTVIVSTGNVGFIVTRLMLLFGFFHYGSRGILDLTHTRLFTFATIRQLFEQAGYQIEEVMGVPAPFPLALGDNALARLLLALNKMLIRISKGLFSYQIFMVLRPLPTLEWLLQTAVETSRNRAAKSASSVG